MTGCARLPSLSSTALSSTLLCISTVLVGFWVIGFPLERAYLRPIVMGIQTQVPPMNVFFLGGPWWRVPVLALALWAIPLILQLLCKNRSLSITCHLIAIVLCLTGIVLCHAELIRWFVELKRNA